ncbi:Mu-like prophage major head subunit gpT family protein [Halodesulfovibrio aestuarii]|uniref:phage major capsid protein n=1 Tax=Halodesulfovibrio aestuarii TaxID=126333 RepID=UPI003D319D4F
MLKPRNGEGKQAFFKRAVQDLMKDGKTKNAAIAEASATWNQHNLSAGGNGYHFLSAPVQFDLKQKDDKEPAEQRTFDILAYAGGIVDLGYYKFIIAVKGIKNKAAFPCLYEHERKAIAGTSTKVSKKNNELFCHGKFHNTAEAAHIIELADDDFPWQASMGIWAEDVRYLARDEKAKVNGIAVTGPLYIWETSEMKEISICSLGQDGETAAITMSCPTTDTEFYMEYSKELKLALGLAADASDVEVEAAIAGLKLTLEDNAAESAIWAALAAGGHLSGSGDGSEETPASPQENLSTPPQGASPAPVAPDVAGEVSKALAAERTRAADIHQIAAKLGLGDDFVQEHINQGSTKEHTLSLAVDLASQQNPSFGSGRLTEGTSESDKVRKLAAEGLCFRLGFTPKEKLSAGAQDFTSMSLLRLASMQLSRSNMPVLQMSNDQIARAILKPSARLDAATTDFIHIFKDVANVALLKAYAESPITFESIVNIVSASDFKEMHGVALSEAPDMELIGENENYPVKTLSDSGESYHIAKYGEILRLSYEMIVNDNLRAFTRIPLLFGAAARRKQGDLVYGLITSNPVMSDGLKLFCGEHKNVCPTATAGKINTASLSAARKAMRKQKGLKGATLDIRPRTLLVPTTLETDAEVMLRSMAAPEGTNAGVTNIFQNSLVPVSDPRLDDASEDAWYTVGDPNQIDTIEMAYLDGNREPEIFEDEDFNSDGIKYKIRQCMGVGLMDHRGMYMNPGKTVSAG